MAHQTEKEQFVFCHYWNFKSSCKCCQVGFTTDLYYAPMIMLHSPTKSTIHQLCSNQSIGGAIPHEMHCRQLPKHDPLWGLDCRLLMWVQSLGSFARQVAMMPACVLHSTLSYCKSFSYICLLLQCRIVQRGFSTRLSEVHSQQFSDEHTTWWSQLFWRTKVWVTTVWHTWA